MLYDRRAFIETVASGAALAANAGSTGIDGVSRQPAGDVTDWRREFPALGQQVNGHALSYLDSAATTLRPREVIAAIGRFDAQDNANPGASLHTLAQGAARHYAAARSRVAAFLNATDASEVIFTKGTTEAINLVASAWGHANLRPGDEIVLTIAEHYSNLLPWRTVAERTGAVVRTVDVDDDGRLRPERVRDALSPRTKLVAFSHVSNVLGLINPAADICAVARARQIPVLIDAAQSAPHVGLDVQALGCDFLAWSSHKLMGPMGVGVLWARREQLERMPPYQLGSNMAHEVDATSAQFEQAALKYQAGTPNVSGRSAWRRRSTCWPASASTHLADTMRRWSIAPGTSSRGCEGSRCSARCRQVRRGCRSSASRFAECRSHSSCGRSTPRASPFVAATWPPCRCCSGLVSTRWRGCRVTCTPRRTRSTLSPTCWRGVAPGQRLQQVAEQASNLR